MTAERDEFLTGGLVPLTCRSCATKVLVKKNSPQHTSIQWVTDAATSCPVFAERVAEGIHPGLLDTCERLHDSISEAAREGVFTYG